MTDPTLGSSLSFNAGPHFAIKSAKPEPSTATDAITYNRIEHIR